ncbi:MAG: hypothetical protein VKQ33_00490 [Candidatus Sericytochromatia bacterium]|nr:hypothetical protein [Candidatus Sericytochromatia bacterium]
MKHTIALLTLGAALAAPSALAATPPAAAPSPLAPVGAALPVSLLDDLTLDFEGGALAFLQNDQRYGSQGTPYTHRTIAQDRNLFGAQRLSLEARALDRHTVIFLYAPLDVTTRVTLGSPLTFRDQTFPAGAVVDHRYLFDGIRATYLYRTLAQGGLTLDLGATLGVRNAEVSLSQVDGTRFSPERDIGPVPALRARLRYDPGQGAYALYDLDAGGTLPGIGTVTGGVLDTALTLGVPLVKGLDGTLRLRYLAGGATVPNREILNWAQFASASAGFRFSPRLFWAPEPAQR